MPAPSDSASKAEQAAAARKARRAAQEAEALRKNLLKRKSQTRAREAKSEGGPESCR